MSNMNAQFITLEGGEGAGKSTCLEHVCSILQNQKIPFIRTREPGGTPFAEEIRDLLLSNREEAVDETAELLLMFAARAQHLNKVIKPALANGTWVVCDRFTDSTYAYQGFARGLDISHIKTLESLVQGTLQPDKTLLMDIDVEQGMARALARSDADRFETEKLSFFGDVRQGFLSRAKKDAVRFSIIDAGKDLEHVKDQISQVILKLITSSREV
jgi:dTMP kinase